LAVPAPQIPLAVATRSAVALLLLLVLVTPCRAAFPSGGEAVGFVKFPVPPARECPAEPDLQGLQVTRVAWMRHGGPDGPMGCPVAVQGEPGGHLEVTFQNGTIVSDARIWEKGYLAAYQSWKGILVDWAIDALAGPGSGPPVGLYFHKFLVRWEAVGATPDQIDVWADGAMATASGGEYAKETHLWTRGTQYLGVRDDDNPGVSDPERTPGIYRVAVKGCDVGAGSRCPQEWLGPATVVMIWPPPPFHRFWAVDLAGVAPAISVGTSQRSFLARASRAIQEAACGRLLPWTNFHNEHGSAVIVLAKMAYAEVFASDRCPGRDLDNRAEVAAWLLTQRVESASGTKIEGIRTGEYDTALIGWIAVVYAFGDKLPPAVYDHFLDTLLNKSGPIDPADHAVTAINVPESENHILNIETSRYLTNQLRCDRARARQQLPPSSCDNESNGMNAWMLGVLQRLLSNDFIEYNSNPYQDYALMSLMNLASYAHDERVRTAAYTVLDYVFVKAAVSSDRLRRSVPYRRKADYYRETFFGEHTDPMVGFLAQLAGNTELLGDKVALGNEMLWAAISEYRIPPAVLDLVLERESRAFYEVFHHATTELYFGSPGYTISAGGGRTAGAYEVFGLSKADDRGLDLATIFLPAERALRSREDAVRFGKRDPMTESSNFCVAPNFACGSKLVVPPGYPATVSRREDDWTFLHDGERFGYYLALYDRDGVAFLEAYDLTKDGNRLSFDDFVGRVLERNRSTQFRAAEVRPVGGPGPTEEPVNRYVTVDGTVIEFVSRPMPRIVSINGAPPFDARGLASGSVADSAGERGLVRVRHPDGASPYAKCELLLDHRDVQRPILEIRGPQQCVYGDPPGFDDKPLCDPIVYVPAPDAPGESLSQRWGDQAIWEDARIQVQLQELVAEAGRLKVRRYQVRVTEKVPGGSAIEVAADSARITQGPTLQYRRARYARAAAAADNPRLGRAGRVLSGEAAEPGGSAAAGVGRHPSPGGVLGGGGGSRSDIREPGTLQQRQWRFDTALGISLDQGIRLEVDMMCGEQLSPRVYALRYLRSDAAGQTLADVMLKFSQPLAH
jgi:hypothetical protein